METTVADQLVALEHQRVRALREVDEAQFDALHDEGYLLCNPTGTVWDKREYLRQLTSGQLVYIRLDPLPTIEVLAADRLAVLRYRCVIELHVNNQDIPAHECWHIDTYVCSADGQWRCRWSQATGIIETIEQPAG